MTELTFIITALNEEKNLGAAVRGALAAFDEYGVKGEALVINDGSADGTGAVAAALAAADPRVKVLTHEAPRGVGASFWDGVDAASGACVMWFPGDNENLAAEIVRYFRLTADVDVVIPFTFNKARRSALRNFLSYLYGFIVNATFGVSFNYTNGTIIYRKSLLRELGTRTTGFFFQTDILVRLAKRGYLFTEVPYRLGVRNEGKSKALSLRSLKVVAAGYLKLFWDLYFAGALRPPDKFAEDSVTARRRTEES